MNATCDCPSPGDSTTDLSRLDRGERNPQDAAIDDGSHEEWALHDWDDAETPAISPVSADAPMSRASAPPKVRPQRQQLLVILLASYASAVTIALIYFVLSGAFTRHQLESLPDIPPLNETEFQYVPPQAALPPGHRLQIGDARRFGHILVEPLHVTTGDVEFVHFTGRSEQTPPQSVPTLKLWVRFTNLSEDQLIAPMDRTLLFKRDYIEDTDQLLANNFLTGRSSGGSRLFIYDHPLSSEWNLKHQQLGTRLAPGESLETFLPLESDDLFALDERLVWRMHIRKGYHAPTGHGVTTLVEVAFNKDEITPETDEGETSS